MTSIDHRAAATLDVGMFIASLNAQRVELAVDGAQLLCNAPKGVLTAELRTTLKEHKSDIVAFIRAQSKAPLSFAQRRLWLLSRLDANSTDYNLNTVIHLAGEFDAAVFEQVINEILRRHSALRTTFSFENEEPVQVVHVVRPFELAVTSLEGSDRQHSETELAEHILRARRRQFDLEHGPLFFVSAFRLAPLEHVVAITMHHIVFDGWSAGILAHELKVLYEAFLAGKPSPLPELPLQYADYARLQEYQKNRDAFGNQEKYWKEQLSGELPTLELPVDRPRAAVRDTKAGVERLTLSKDLVNALREFGREQNATLFMVMLAAFKALLFRLTAQSDVIVGTPVANRTRVESEQIIGFFTNTLVLRTPVNASDSVRDLVQRVRRISLDAYANQEVHFEKLVELVQPARDLSRTPLFQAMFALQNVPPSDIRFGNLTITPIRVDFESAKTDVTFELYENEIGISADIDYSAALFDSASIRRLWSQYEQVLRAVVRNPEQHVGSLAILDDDSLRTIVTDWNATRSDYDRTATLHGLIQSTAAQFANAVAITADNVELTYGDLERRASALAWRLHERGIRRGALVAICVDRSVDMVVGILAILKVGAAYVPIDPKHPSERQAYVLSDSKASCVVVHRSTRNTFQNTHVPQIDVDDADNETDNDARSTFASPDGTFPVADVTATDPAYVIYTSGSTGKPKGVVVSHRNVVNFLHSMRSAPGFARSDSLLAVTTLAFDIAGLELWLPLVCGGRVVIASRDAAQSTSELARLLADFDITVMQATPTTWQALVDAGWAGNQKLRALVGGEALPTQLATALHSRVGEVWNMYGPTETTVWSTIHKMTSPSDRAVPIGKPIANTRVYVLDASNQPTAIGVDGELCIAGDGVALGYLGRPDLTNEKFVTLRVPLAGSEKVYRTGDVAHWRADGELEFVGRRDNQIKLRGYRIELGELESALVALPSIKQAVVVARDAKPGDTRLAAFVIVENGKDLTASEIRQQLRQHLPDYMIPAAVVELHEYPLSANGKIARNSLPNPFVGHARPSHSGEAPAAGVESAIAEIWRDVLGAPTVNAHDNFFELGGHSLLSMRVVARMEQRFAWRMDPRELFFKSLRQVAGSVPGEIRTRIEGASR